MKKFLLIILYFLPLTISAQVEEDYIRWSAEFSYGEVNYFIWFNDMEKSEVEKVIDNLYFF